MFDFTIDWRTKEIVDGLNGFAVANLGEPGLAMPLDFLYRQPRNRDWRYEITEEKGRYDECVEHARSSANEICLVVQGYYGPVYKILFASPARWRKVINPARRKADPGKPYRLPPRRTPPPGLAEGDPGGLPDF